MVEGLDAEMGFTLPPVLAEEKEETPRPRVRRKVLNQFTHTHSHRCMCVYMDAGILCAIMHVTTPMYTSKHRHY